MVYLCFCYFFAKASRYDGLYYIMWEWEILKYYLFGHPETRLKLYDASIRLL